MFGLHVLRTLYINNGVDLKIEVKIVSRHGLKAFSSLI